MKDNKNTIFKKIYIVFGLIILFGYIFTIFNYGRQNLYYPESEPLVFIKDKIELKNSDGKSEIVNLPVNKKGNKSYSYSFRLKPLKNGSKTYLKIKAFYLSYELKSADELIYSYKADENALVKSNGFNLALIEVDDKYLNKDIKIEFHSNLGGKHKVKIPYIVAGEKALLIGNLLKANLFEVIAAFMFFITGFFLIISFVALLVLKLPYKKMLTLSMLAIIAGVYVLSSLEITLYYFDNNLLTYFLEYTTLNLLMIPILLLIIDFIEETKDKSKAVKVLRTLIILACMNIVFQWLLLIMGITEFRAMRSFTNAFLSIVSVLVLYIIIKLDKNEFYQKKYIFISVFPMVVFTIIIVALQSNGFLESVDRYIIIAFIMLFLVVQYVYFIKQYVSRYNIEIKDSFYKELAYFDSLTGLLNEHAFNRDMRKLRYLIKKPKSMTFTMIDMNNLKYLNDKFGHNVGDLYLKELANILLEFSKVDDIKAYRCGGDEFYLVIFDHSYEFARELIKKIRNKAKAFVLKDLALSFAAGTVYVNILDDFDLGKIMSLADKKMYENKKKIKEEDAAYEQ